MLIPPFVAGMGAVGYGPALHLLPSTLAVLVGGRVEGLLVYTTGHPKMMDSLLSP